MAETLFYLGTHQPHWLGLARVPLFVSRRALGRYKTMPRAASRWALDSGGFTELAMHGSWLTTPAVYVAEIRRFRADIGMLDWAAPQDWMCEPVMLKRTGLSVVEHQRRTIDNYLELRSLAPELPIIPVLQGWSAWDYIHHAKAYRDRGVALESLPVVGVGSVCRRQNTAIASRIFSLLEEDGLSNLHGFGLKKTGLRAFAGKLASADSLAWSYRARREPPMIGHPHKNCANCLPYAMVWRDEVLAAIKFSTEAA